MTAIRDPRLVTTLAVPGALGAAAIAAAVVAGGLPGFLLGFTAALVAVDRLLDLGDLRTVGADRPSRGSRASGAADCAGGRARG